MPDREIIHCSKDVFSLLAYAIDSGMQVMVGAPCPEPLPWILNYEDLTGLERGVFYLFRSEWVFGAFQVMPIATGYNRGKFFVQPRVNYSPITAYFGGERETEGKRRFGGGTLSFHSDWLQEPGKTLHPTPPDVKGSFESLFEHLTSGVVIKAGVHRYDVCRGVIADPSAGRCGPPFDFIPWSDELLQRYGG